jgi:2-polyprenyl-6-methoxyphenol hydroxylase-like FAD-dependent oxidoreductase
MQSLDIAVCGCGPAGLAAALFLNRAGHRVVLIERFERPQPVGSGLILQPPGLAVLDALGLGRHIRTLGHPIWRLDGRSVGSGRTVLAVDYAALGAHRHGLAVHRAALFDVLFSAVKAERIPVESDFDIRGLSRSEAGRPLVTCRAGRRLGAFDLVIDALGSRSAIAQQLYGPSLHRPLSYGALWASLPWPGAPFSAHTLAQRYQAASIMIGVLPIGRRAEGSPEEVAFFWSLKPLQYPDWRRTGLAVWREQVSRLWPETAVLVEHIRDPDQLILASYGHHTMRDPTRDRLVFIGDSAHSTSPQLGQGANMALLDAAALALAIEQHQDLGDALTTYRRMRGWHIRLYQALSAFFTPFYQSDSRLLPALRDNLFAPVGWLPGMRQLLASLVASQWGAPLHRIGLTDRPTAAVGQRAA